MLGLDDDNKGTTRDPLGLSYAIAGAQLAELALADRIGVDAETVVALDTTRTGDENLDELLARIAGAERPRTPGHWVMKRRSAGLAVYARRLELAGVLRGESRRLLGFVPHTVFPIVDAAVHGRALAQVRVALEDPSAAAPEPRTRALIALLHACGIARRLIEDSGQRARAERMAADDVIAGAVKQAVDAVHAVHGSVAGAA